MVSMGPPPISCHGQPFAWACVPSREVRGETSAWSRAESQHQTGDEPLVPEWPPPSRAVTLPRTLRSTLLTGCVHAARPQPFQTPQ